MRRIEIVDRLFAETWRKHESVRRLAAGQRITGAADQPLLSLIAGREVHVSSATVEHIIAGAAVERGAGITRFVNVVRTGDQNRECGVGRAAVAVADGVVEQIFGDTACRGDRARIGIAVAIAAVGIERQNAERAVDGIADIVGRPENRADA